MITITRKIQINPIGTDEKRKETWVTFRRWNELVFRAANQAVTQMYYQDKAKEFIYFNEGFEKLKQAKEEFQNYLECSEQNTTYRFLSSKLKGDIPSSIFGSLNNQLKKVFDSEKIEYFSGKRSLRTYKRDMPIPFQKTSIRNLKKIEGKKDYSFSLFGHEFQTFFGRDNSGNELILDRVVNEEYKLCDSSIQIKNKKMFLLAIFQFEPDIFKKIDVEKEIFCRFDENYPIIVKNGDKDFMIGTANEYVHRRLNIRRAIKKIQYGTKYAKSGKGRKKKLQAIERFRGYEKNYINTKMHDYSRELINYCVKNKIGKINLVNYNEKMEEGKETLSNKNKEPLIRTWSFFNLKNKIIYKAAFYGIEISEDKIIQNEDKK